MALKTYRAKRKFKDTPEPLPKKGKRFAQLRFCVQKHAATKLHYDFRLEYRGVLLSWAVPKGPSMDPADKRLAIKVEDHPLDYINFEGNIPKGNYGAGSVEIWDKGSYVADKPFTQGLKKGHLEFELRGKKLNGRFSLVKIKSDKGDAWLLIKSAELPKTKMPSWVEPMLAKLVDKPFDDDDWLFEVKWDGYRALSFLDGTTVKIFSRNQNALNKQFPKMVDALKKLKIKAIFDGELVVLDARGIAKFELLQNCAKNPDCNLHYYVFDLLYLNGHDLRSLPLVERKTLLREILPSSKSSLIHFGDHVEARGKELFQLAQKNQLEGLIGKRKSSPYLSRRSSDWVKIKTTLRDEAIIGGFTKPRGARKKFGSLLLGTYQNGELVYIGHVGTGFNDQLLDELYKKMRPLIQKTCPFSKEPPANEKATWIKPKLVCEVSFAEWTQDKKMRQPVFHGLRTDKSPQEVEPEQVFSNLNKVFWKADHYTKGDMIEYYRSVSPYILPHLKDRAMTLHRFPNGINQKSFFQKKFEDHTILVQDESALLWAANLGSIEMHPMAARVNKLDYPDYLAIDLDPQDVPFKKVIEAANTIHDLLESLRVPNFCKTSGSRGLHIYVPLGAQVPYRQVKQLALLLATIARDQMPNLISLERSPSKRLKRIYFDYLQNIRGRTMAATYSIRPLDHAPVSTPLEWKEVNAGLDPLEFTIKTIPARLQKKGDLFKDVLGKGINLHAVLKRLNDYLG